MEENKDIKITGGNGIKEYNKAMAEYIKREKEKAISFLGVSSEVLKEEIPLGWDNTKKNYIMGFDPYKFEGKEEKATIVKLPLGKSEELPFKNWDVPEKEIEDIEEEPRNLQNVLYYLQGNIRYKLFYSRFAFLIRKHILEQINSRILSMKKECYDTGSCVKCGCATVQLQMCNKACKGSCYPSMQNKKNWALLKDKKIVFSDSYFWELRNGKFKKYG